MAKLVDVRDTFFARTLQEIFYKHSTVSFSNKNNKVIFHKHNFDSIVQKRINHRQFIHDGILYDLHDFKGN